MRKTSSMPPALLDVNNVASAQPPMLLRYATNSADFSQPAPLIAGLDDRPDKDELAELAGTIYALSVRVAHYRGRAAAIDEDFRLRQERDDYGLDAVPYGEEMIRSRGFSSDLRGAALLTRSEVLPDTSADVARSQYDEAARIAEEIEGTLDEFAPLPPQDEDSDG